MKLQSTVLLTLLENQVQAMGAEDVAEEVVHEEAITKDVADKAETSTTQHTHKKLETSREKLIILVQS